MCFLRTPLSCPNSMDLRALLLKGVTRSCRHWHLQLHSRSGRSSGCVNCFLFLASGEESSCVMLQACFWGLFVLAAAVVTSIQGCKNHDGFRCCWHSHHTRISRWLYSKIRFSGRKLYTYNWGGSVILTDSVPICFNECRDKMWFHYIQYWPICCITNGVKSVTSDIHLMITMTWRRARFWNPFSCRTQKASLNRFYDLHQSLNPSLKENMQMLSHTAENLAISFEEFTKAR